MTLRDKISDNLSRHPDVSLGDAEFMSDAILDLIKDNISLGEWYCPDGETVKYQDRLFSYSIYPNNLGEFTLDDGESVKSYRTIAAAKDGALEHKRNTIMSEIGG